MKYLKLSIAVLSGLSLALVCGLVVNVITDNATASNVAAAGAGALAAFSLRADI